jgi:membrane protein DedA with SNARE-associated domain
LIAVATADQLSGVAGWMTTLIDALGPIGVGIVILIETVFPPIPSEVVLPAAGYLAGIGQLSWWSTLLWSTVGSVVGAWTLYGVGALVGADRIGRLAGRLPLMSEHDVDRAWAAFDRWRSPVVFWGRLIPGVRSLVSLPAGAQRMPLPRFTVLTTFGSAIWNSALLAAGWWLGDRYGATAAVSHWANTAVLAGAVVFVAWFTARRLRERRRRTRTTTEVS